MKVIQVVDKKESILTRVFNWAIDPSIINGDPDLLRKAQLSIIVAWVMVGIGFPFAFLFYFVLNSVFAGYAVVITCVLAAIAPIVLKITKSVKFVGHYTVFVVYCLLIVNGYICGGYGSGPLTWEVALPMAAIFLVGKRAGYFWATACSVVLLVYYLIRQAGIVVGANIPPESLLLFHVLASIALIFVITSFSYFFEVTKNQAFEKLNQTQSILIQSAKMHALGEMAGGVAHEINNPLAIVQSNLELVIDQLKISGVPNKDFVEARLKSAQITTNRIANIVRGLRSFSRTGELDPYRVNSVETLLAETLQLCHEKFISNGIKVKVEIGNPSLEIQCRDIQVSQVLLNLLNNAFDALTGLEDKWIKIDINQIHSQVEISVTDSGKGIEPELAERIFQPFFTTKEIGKGTGLGLSIAKGLIESHKGILFLDPNSSHTRFVIRLPIYQA